VLHPSGKAATVNSALLKMIEDRKLDHRPANKANNGEIRGIGAIAVADDVFDQVLGPMSSCDSFLKFSSAARRCGITTVGDSSGAVSTVELLTAWKKVIREHGGIRVLIYNAPLLPLIHDTGPIIEEVLAARRASEPLVRMGAVYVPVDGEIQDFNAVLRWPGYFNGAANGKLRVDPEIFGQVLLDLHRRGISVHSHCEGDGAVDVFVNAVSDALRQYPWLEHRHSIDHSHLVTTDQCRAMAKLGIGANIFVGDLWRWGDQHLLISVGPERARRITACATARREGVHFSIHSDPFVTSHGPLHAMWCAVNRITPDGRVLGKEEAISPYEAMYACTVDAAYQLGMDNEIGTIEAGKWADFAVIEADPFTIDPTELRHITVWGTVVAGQVFPRKSTA
jgi:predicted amidohydrolase YtcJ